MESHNHIYRVTATVVLPVAAPSRDLARAHATIALHAALSATPPTQDALADIDAVDWVSPGETGGDR